MDFELVKRRLFEQDEYVKRILRSDLTERENLDKYKKFLKTDLIKAIIGPRRAGKTTLGLMLLRENPFYYVNFDDEILISLKPDELGFLIEKLNDLFGKKDFIFLDEIQNIPCWELFVNRLQRNGYNVIISGSNSNLLSKELSTHLGGRTITISLYPFCYREFLKLSKIENFSPTDEGIGLAKNLLRNYINQGGYPEVLLKLKDDELRKNYFDEIINTVLIRDIAQRYNLKHSIELKSLSVILINQFSSRMSLTKMSNSLGIGVNTIKKYIEYLNESFLVLSSKKFSYKPREMEQSYKKYYLIDTGLINFKKTTLTMDFGKLMENLVAIELLRRDYELYYYLAEDKFEVDFVVAKGNSIKEVIQVVFDDTFIPKREINSGIKVCRELKCKNLKLLTWNKNLTEKIDNININYIPLWSWLIEK